MVLNQVLTTYLGVTAMTHPRTSTWKLKSMFVTKLEVNFPHFSLTQTIFIAVVFWFSYIFKVYVVFSVHIGKVTSYEPTKTFSQHTSLTALGIWCISVNSPYCTPKVVRQASKSKPQSHLNNICWQTSSFFKGGFLCILHGVSLLIKINSLRHTGVSITLNDLIHVWLFKLN